MADENDEGLTLSGNEGSPTPSQLRNEIDTFEGSSDGDDDMAYDTVPTATETETEVDAETDGETTTTDDFAGYLQDLIGDDEEDADGFFGMNLQDVCGKGLLMVLSTTDAEDGLEDGVEALPQGAGDDDGVAETGGRALSTAANEATLRRIQGKTPPLSERITTLSNVRYPSAGLSRDAGWLKPRPLPSST